MKGTVLEVIFRNADNGYCVLYMEGGGRFFTAVGVFPPLTEGEILDMEGNWVNNSRFGEQFRVTSVKVSPPTSKEAIFKYLSSGLFKGVGEVTAYSIVEKFGEKALDVIENSPQQLAAVKGISLKKALAIQEAMIGLKEMQDTIVYLQNYGVSLNLAIKIFKAYDKSTRRVVENNPYQLVDDIDGVGFLTADKIATAIGIAPDSRFRVGAAIVHVLKEAANKNGDTYLPENDVVDQVDKLLRLERTDSAELVAEMVEDCEITGKIVRLEKDGEKVDMLARNYICEKSIATFVQSMLSSAESLPLDADEEIELYEKLNNIKLHPSQAEAVRSCLKKGVTIITGGPGTGKTTIVKCIIHLLRGRNYSVCLCAPTGRAAKRLTETTGVEAKTIHRLLDLDFSDGKGKFLFNETAKLDEDVVIVDEVSMCDDYVFNALVKAIKFGGRLIMVGDKDQLPSVGAGNVLADLIASGKVPVSYLTHIYRQSEDSLIVENAHRINAGKMPVINNRSRDFFFDNKSDPNEILRTVVDMITRRIPAYAGVASPDIQLLCPMKKGVIGVENMNTTLQEALNPPQKGKAELKVGLRTFRVGDKVMHTVNNYELQWTDDEGAAGTGVFNGDIGRIDEINTAEPSLTVAFDDGKRVKYMQGDFDDLTLAYAISVHKAQGSEFPVVIIALMSGNYMILTRNLLYTAVTRAKEMAVLVGSSDNLEKMVRNNYTAKRYSMLESFLRAEKH